MNSLYLITYKSLMLQVFNLMRNILKSWRFAITGSYSENISQVLDRNTCALWHRLLQSKAGKMEHAFRFLFKNYDIYVEEWIILFDKTYFKTYMFWSSQKFPQYIPMQTRVINHFLNIFKKLMSSNTLYRLVRLKNYSITSIRYWANKFQVKAIL